MKRSVLLLISGILGLCYVIYLISYFGGGLATSSSNAALVGAGLAATLVAPHMICVVLAVVFNISAWYGNVRWAALVAGILYAVAMVCFVLYAVFVIVQTILCFIAYARMNNNVQDKSVNNSADTK